LLPLPLLLLLLAGSLASFLSTLYFFSVLLRAALPFCASSLAFLDFLSVLARPASFCALFSSFTGDLERSLALRVLRVCIFLFSFCCVCFPRCIPIGLYY
jgi:hypothetical protein